MHSYASNNKALSLAGLIVALGVVFGDIGTSPLYTVKATIFLAGGMATQEIVFGIISLIFWTLTIQTTVKYVVITLRADNNGEGGIFSLFTLVKESKYWLVFVAITGGAMLLADGIITPAITVTSAIQGLRLLIPTFPQSTVIIIILVILAVLFFIQKFGTSIVGKMFGPLMLIWFIFIGFVGVYNIRFNPEILLALNPISGLKLLFSNPVGIFILGGVFLCTTGAEALYSDMGHCGRNNIKISWIFVKIMLVLNYCGQGAHLLTMTDTNVMHVDPFFDIIPRSFLIFGVVIATIAAIIASQALISASFTLVSEAIKLNLFPKINVVYPTNIKGQIYIPWINTFLWLGSGGIVLFFQNSENMEAAYGLAITITMLMTLILLFFYLKKNVNRFVAVIVFSVYLTIETIFLFANLQKFAHGGYVTLGLALVLMSLMYVWFKGYRIKVANHSSINIIDYSDQFEMLANDKEIPFYATNLIFLSEVQDPTKVERKIIYSILNRRPKRAKHYWFVHISITDEPYTSEYSIHRICDHCTKITLHLGFRIRQKINNFMKCIIGEMVKKGEIEEQPRKYSINLHKDIKEHVRISDMTFVLLNEYLSNYNDLSLFQTIIMKAKMFIKKFTVSPIKWFGLESSSVADENAPIIMSTPKNVSLSRVDDE